MSNNDLTQVEAFVKDLGQRVAATAVTTAGGTATVLWAGSGLHVRDLLTVTGWDKAWTLVGAGVLAAILEAARTTVFTYFSARKARITAEVKAELETHVAKVVDPANEAKA